MVDFLQRQTNWYVNSLSSSALSERFIHYTPKKGSYSPLQSYLGALAPRTLARARARVEDLVPRAATLIKSLQIINEEALNFVFHSGRDDIVDDREAFDRIPHGRTDVEGVQGGGDGEAGEGEEGDDVKLHICGR